jgi:hypothetical protein
MGDFETADFEIEYLGNFWMERKACHGGKKAFILRVCIHYSPMILRDEAAAYFRLQVSNA